MAEQADLFLTGRVVCEFVEHLITGIERAVDQILAYMSIDNTQTDRGTNNASELSPKESRARAFEITKEVILIIRRGIDAVNSFSRLSMGVNLQFINAANYELLTQTSAHKILCAYYEFAHELAEDYSHIKPGDNGIANRKICVLPIPHFNSVQPEAQLLYPHGYVDLVPPKEPPIHPAVVRVPNIDTFLRVYEIVPYLRHEYNHFLHLRNSSEENNYVRNIYLLRNTMVEISRLIVLGLAEYAGAEYSLILKEKRGTDRLINCVAAVLITNFFDDEKLEKLLPNMLFTEIKAVLIRFLKDSILHGSPNDVEMLSRKDGVDILFELIEKYANPGDKNITREYLENLKKDAYSARSMYADEDATYDKHMQMVNYAFRDQQLFSTLLQQIDDSIKNIQIRLDILNIKIQSDSASDREIAEQLKLRNLHRQEKNRRENFCIEWKYVEDLFFDALQQPPYNSGNRSDVTTGIRIGGDMIKKVITREIIKALDDNISDIELSANIPLRLMQEYERIRVWVKRKGDQVPLFWKLGEDLIRDTVNNCFTTYNEARSDIFMCKTLTFNSAGYVYFLVRSMARNMNDPIDAAFYRRVLLTMHSLCETKVYSTSALYHALIKEYELLVQARVTYLNTKLDILCDGILITAPKKLFSKQYVDIADFSGTKDNETIAAVETIKSSLCGALNREQKRRNERFKRMCENELNIRVRDYMDAEADERRSSIENLFIAFPELSVLSEGLSVCRQVLNYNENPGVGHGEQRKECERFVNRYDSMVALCADQFSDLLEVERLLYKVRRLPECQVYEIEHTQQIAKVYAERHSGLEHKNANINRVITRIGEYYNGSCGEDVATEYTTRKMTDDGVKFINEFYWKNRARMADWRKPEAEDDK
jgi:hypothetical protein